MLGLSVGMAVACVAIVYVGSTVQASIGIGLGMIASPMLLLADPDFIPAAIMLAVLPLTFTIAWVDRRHIAPRDVGFAVAGRIPGTIAMLLSLLYRWQKLHSPSDESSIDETGKGRPVKDTHRDLVVYR